MEFYFRHFNRSPGFKAGYGGNYDSPEEQARIALYDLYLDLILVIEWYSRHSGEDHLKWAESNLAEGWERLNR